ncbi:Protein-lysine N-methyltransferase rrg1 [Elasticomyces elasticus]|nr:Protein-lysine N-methyltransferase rrg1 [Elasticomyces elasticus]KAK3660640.1 Protein-lysine N-methyltransferase rrg1 [Elasticomyces elasticus]KAK4915558.1 Protein-lysine N-methyltransferase rrg1 [Elasticomyces elasticus]KAK5755077.1 Protein-lysine N-methyltransferase rrg1 [Elasticomyces elasticus]
MANDQLQLSANDLGLQTDDELLDVLDLPQLYTQPSAQILLSTLDDLTSQPSSWEATPRTSTPRSLSGASTPLRWRRKVRSEGVPHYLTKIIASPLAWIEDDGEKERVWQSAAQRMSERSGRMARGDLRRGFKIPLHAANVKGGCVQDREVEDAEEMFEITLHEPAMTADSMGFKTWASSYLLAKRLSILRETLPRMAREARILELGAGTGLVGLAAAVILQRTVVLTDLPEILPNLQRNVRDNAAVLATHGAKVETAVLDWSHPEDFTLPYKGDRKLPPHTFPLILAADAVYASTHPELLVRAIGYHLCRGGDTRVVVEIPIREGFGAERDEFRERMKGLGLRVLGEGEEVGYDDWGGGDGDGDGDWEEAGEVVCWWSVWGWG